MGSLVKFFLIGFLALVAIGVVLAILGKILSFTLGLAWFLLFKVAPLVLLGYIIVRIIGARQKRLAAADQKWLEGG